MLESDFKVLFQAARDGNIARVKDIFMSIQLKKSIYLRDTDISLFYKAAQNVDCIIATTDPTTEIQVDTPLQIAAGNDDVDSIIGLATSGANVNAPDKSGATPVYIAAQHGRVEAIKALALFGANVNSTFKKDGFNPMLIAAHYGHVNAIMMLSALEANASIRAKNGATPLFVAAGSGCVNVVKALCALGVDVNTPRNDGMTAIFVASQYGHLAVVKALSASGADINTPTNDGTTPVLVAAQYGYCAVVKFLYSMGATIGNASVTGDCDAAKNRHSFNNPAAAICIENVIKKMNSECECCGCIPEKLLICSCCDKIRYCSIECQK